MFCLQNLYEQSLHVCQTHTHDYNSLIFKTVVTESSRCMGLVLRVLSGLLLLLLSGLCLIGVALIGLLLVLQTSCGRALTQL